MKFLHTMLRVGDLQRSIDFYTRFFGMSLKRTTDRPEQQYTLAFVGYDVPGAPQFNPQGRSFTLMLTYALPATAPSCGLVGRFERVSDESAVCVGGVSI